MARETLWESLRASVSAARRGVGEVVDTLLAPLGFDSGARRQVAFTTGLIALAAKMARADGVVTVDEVQAFDQIMDIPEAERTNVERLFELAQADVAGFDHYARRLAGLLADESHGGESLFDVLDALFHVAKADGVVHEREVAYLAQVAEIFGITQDRFAQILSMHTVPQEGDPYVTLGLERSASDAQLRERYRTLVRQGHPDTMQARGVPTACLKLANERLAMVNRAYDLIRRERQAQS